MRQALVGLAIAVVLGTLGDGSALAADVEDAAADARELLGRLVAADTSNPPGNEARAVEILTARLDAAKIPYEVTEFAPGRKNLVARLRGDGSARPLLLLAHLDVVGADGQAWTSPPHVMTERDGFLVGRGVNDDLGMAVVNLETLLWLARSGTQLRRDVIAAFTGDEESGGGGIRWLIEHHPDVLAAEIALNEGGGIRLGEHGEPSYVGLQTAEKTYQDYVLAAKGTTGHSSVPMADNAIVRLSTALERVGRHRFPVRLLAVTREYMRARAAVESGALAAALREAAESRREVPKRALAVLEANPTLAAMLRTTCVATIVSGGTRANALPAEAHANVNCRILPDETIEDVRKALGTAVADPAVTIEMPESFGMGPPSALDGAVPTAIRKIVAGRWPKVPVVPLLSLGATDSRFLRKQGVACYGFNPIALAEGDARRAHGIDERIPVTSLTPALEIYRALIVELAVR